MDRGEATKRADELDHTFSAEFVQQLSHELLVGFLKAAQPRDKGCESRDLAICAQRRDYGRPPPDRPYAGDVYL